MLLPLVLQWMATSSTEGGLNRFVLLASFFVLFPPRGVRGVLLTSFLSFFLTSSFVWSFVARSSGRSSGRSFGRSSACSSP